MELIKKNIHMNRLKGKIITQLTLEDDFNVPDVKPDIDQMIKDCSEIKIESVKVLDGRVIVKGKLLFKILYSSLGTGKLIHNLNGDINFEEPVNINGVIEDDAVDVNWEIEDVNVGIINSRKFSVKALVTLKVIAENLYDEETAVDVTDEDPIEYIKKSMNIAQIAVKKKDIFRIKEEMEISQNKPNINEILWTDLSIRNIDTKLLDDKISLRGELLVFVLYSSEDEEAPIQWVENTIPFTGMIDASDVREEMIPNIDIRILNAEIESKPDYDGEQRVISLDVVLDLDISVYEEENVEILHDVYSSVKELKTVLDEAHYENVLVKNASRCKVADKVKVDSSKCHVLQICSSEGNVKIDDVEIVQDGINLSGVVEISILYVSTDDKYPLCSTKAMIPFTHTIEAKGIKPDSVIYLKQYIEQLNAVMISSDEIECKVSIILDALVLNKIKEPIIVGIEESPIDIEKIQAMPGIVGYLVQEEDTLWKIAKKFYTTVDSIKEINSLTSENVKKGDRLLVVKQVEGMEF
jgi:hypothetical protein